MRQKRTQQVNARELASTVFRQLWLGLWRLQGYNGTLLTLPIRVISGVSQYEATQNPFLKRDYC